MPLRRPIGVVDLVFAQVSPPEAARRAAELGFDHIDLTVAWPTDADGGSVERLALPIGDRCTERPVDGCTVPALPSGEGAWERAVRAYRHTPGARVEPWPGPS